MCRERECVSEYWTVSEQISTTPPTHNKHGWISDQSVLKQLDPSSHQTQKVKLSLIRKPENSHSMTLPCGSASETAMLHSPPVMTGPSLLTVPILNDREGKKKGLMLNCHRGGHCRKVETMSKRASDFRWHERQSQRWLSVA
jgi:hypothetical protein